jgi:type IV pilus assembly protein PilE
MIRSSESDRSAGPVDWHGGGFTLLELMMVLVIVAVLAAIVLPSYQNAVNKGRRPDGTSALLDLANRLQRYYSENNTFATATIAAGAATDLLTSATTAQGYYTLSITAKAANTYTIQATRAGAQVADTKCGDLTLTSTSIRGVSGAATVADCW